MKLFGRHLLGICAVGFIAGCKSESKDQAATPPDAPVAAAAESSGTRVQDSAKSMAGMDHSNMPGMQPTADAKRAVGASGGAAPIAGVDHSKMDMTPSPSGAAPRNRASTDMAGMDHSQMNMGPAAPKTAGRSQATNAMQGMAGMDHGSMTPNRAQSTSRRPAQATPGGMGAMTGMGGMTGMTGMGSMAGMDHSQMSGMQMPAMSANLMADRKLQMLAAALLKDPDIMRRVQADSVLRNRWSDPGVRTQISNAAGGEHK